MAKAVKKFKRTKKPVQTPAECYFCKEKKEPVKVDYYVCSVCGNTVEGSAPEKCPICGAPKEKFFKPT